MLSPKSASTLTNAEVETLRAMMVIIDEMILEARQDSLEDRIPPEKAVSICFLDYKKDFKGLTVRLQDKIKDAYAKDWQVHLQMVRRDGTDGYKLLICDPEPADEPEESVSE